MHVRRSRLVLVAIFTMAGVSACSADDGGPQDARAASSGDAASSVVVDADAVPEMPTSAPEAHADAPLVQVDGIVHEELGALEVCEDGVECAGEIVVGVELADLPGAEDGVSDRVRLAGRFDGHTLTVTEPVEAADPMRRPGAIAPIPCPVPEGGWPQRLPSDPGALDAYIAAHRDEYAGRWNAPGVPVLAFTGDVEAHAAAVGAVWDSSVCVTGLRYTEDHLNAVNQALLVETRWPPATLRGGGPDVVDNVVRISFWRTDQATLDDIDRRYGDAVEATAYMVVLDRSVTEIPGAPPAGPEEIRIVTADQPMIASNDALASFTLRYDAVADCIWLETTRSEGGRVQMVWPYGTRALRDPVRVVDADGETILTEGDSFSIGGGEGGLPSREPTCDATGTWAPGGHEPDIEG
jgi:hypothetical protein